MEEQLEENIKIAVNHGYRTFYTGLCNGFDLIAAEKVLALQNPFITLVGVVPFNRKARDSYYKSTQQILSILQNQKKFCHS